jgi:hypothetical protein
MTSCSAYGSLADFWANGAIFDGIRCTFVGPLPAEAVALVFLAAPLLALAVASRRAIVPVVVLAFGATIVVVQLPAGLANAVGLVVLLIVVAVGYIAWQRVVSFRG